MKIEDIKKVLILGGGTMGCQIGFQCAIHGYDVVIYDISQEILDAAIVRIKKLHKSLAAKGGSAFDEEEKVLSMIKTTTDPEAAAKDADIVSESVPEDPDLKGNVFSQFNKLCPRHTLFTTNTSTLLPSMYAAETGRPEKFLAFHFHDVRVTRIVDIMPHPETAKETVDLVEAFARRIEQIPIVLEKENNGFVFNAMLTSLLSAALTLAANKVASVEDIDRSWMGVTQMFPGPFGLMDSVGLDTVLKITEYWADKKNDPQGKANAEFIRSYVDKGELGAKTKKGFYSYPEPAFIKQGFLEGKIKSKFKGLGKVL